MNLLDKVIEVFDGEIMVDNKWRVDGSNGKHYTVEWCPYEKKYSCGCKGYIYRKRCRHITELSERFRREFRARHN
jgi:hypothetical protein